MNLSEIEAQADELLERLASTGSAGEVRDICFRLDGLKNAAQIKSTVAFRKEREDELTRMKGIFQQNLPNNYSSVLLPAPSKPAVDRLHELVSYLKTRAGVCYTRGDQEPELEGQHRNTAKAYDDAATKLDEILREGEL